MTPGVFMQVGLELEELQYVFHAHLQLENLY